MFCCCDGRLAWTFHAIILKDFELNIWQPGSNQVLQQYKPGCMSML